MSPTIAAPLLSPFISVKIAYGTKPPRLLREKAATTVRDLTESWGNRLNTGQLFAAKLKSGSFLTGSATLAEVALDAVRFINLISELIMN